MIRAEANGKTLHFDYDSMNGMNEVFKDRETGSKWQQTLSEATSGPLKGSHLEIYPFLLTQWGEWRKQHPDTLVLKPLPGYAERMPGLNKFISQQWSLVAANKPAPKGAFGNDNRLSPHEIILGLEIGGQSKAYSLSALRKVHVVNDRVGKSPVLIVHQPESDTTTAFDPRLNGKALKFRAADAGKRPPCRSPDALHLERLRPVPLRKVKGIAAKINNSRTRVLVCLVGISPEDRSLCWSKELAPCT